MPMASTRPNSERLLSEKPSAASTAKVPISDTGMATIGMIDARQVCRNRMITTTTRTTASNMVVNHRFDRLRDEHGRVVDDVVSQPVREGLATAPPSPPAPAAGGGQRVGAGPLEDAHRDRHPLVEIAAAVVVGGAELDAADVADADHAPVGVGLDDDVAERLRRRSSRPCVSTLSWKAPGCGTGG